MIPFCWLVGGGDQERTKEVELTLAATTISGGALGAEKKTNHNVLITNTHPHSMQLVCVNHSH